MRTFDVTVWYTDGTLQIIPKVTHTLVEDGILHLFYRSSEMMVAKPGDHRGSIPLVNVKRWVKERVL